MSSYVPIATTPTWGGTGPVDQPTSRGIVLLRTEIGKCEGFPAPISPSPRSFWSTLGILKDANGKGHEAPEGAVCTGKC